MDTREKIVALSAVCDVQIGYTARGRLRPADAGVPVVQLSDLQDKDVLDPVGLPHFELTPSFDRYWARAGDVLFRSRGERSTATLIAPETESAAVAVLPLVVLHPRRDLIDPAYLAWFINQPLAQRYLDKSAQTSGLRMIPKTALDGLPLTVPDLATQRLIVAVHALAREEQTLAQRLADKKREFLEFALLRQARNAQLHADGAGRIVARY